MKRLKVYYIPFLLIMLLSTGANAQEKAIIDNISNTLNIGSSKELARYFNEVVELKIDGEKENYSMRQAEAMMKNFFEKYPPTGFVKIHNGSSPEGLLYVLGKYSHKKGSHRVYMLIKQLNNGTYKVDTFDLTKE